MCVYTCVFVCVLKYEVALRTPARATLTFDRQLHYLILVQFNQNYTHIVGKMLESEIWMLYSHLQFEVMNAVVVIEPVLCFFPIILWSATSCRHPNFARQFWYEKTLKSIRILRQCMQNMP